MSNTQVRRINLFGGPGCGKSSVASWLFSRLKEEGIDVEFVSEYIKSWAYIPRNCDSFDQLYVFSKQVHQEDTILRSGTQVVVNECPILLNCFYGLYNNHPGSKHLISIANEFEAVYPSFNIFLAREGDTEYSEKNRFHTKKEAVEIDQRLLEQLVEWFPDMRCQLKERGSHGTPVLNMICNRSQKQNIFDTVIERLQNVTVSGHSRKLSGSVANAS